MKGEMEDPASIQMTLPIRCCPISDAEKRREKQEDGGNLVGGGRMVSRAEGRRGENRKQFVSVIF